MNAQPSQDQAPLAIDGTQYFPDTFFSSRCRFVEAARQAGAEMFSLPVSTVTQGFPEPLTIEIAVCGSLSARKKILHISGTHGAEGAAGAAIQHAILREQKPIPEDCAVIFVHCLNPWGMSMQRRVNEANVDLNRNSVLNPEQRRGAPAGYDDIRSILLPGRAMGFAEFIGRALWKVVRYGFPAVKQAVTGGQFVDPNGLFFGGHELQPELVALREWLSTALSESQRVISIDVHTGLGEFGEDALLLDVADESDEFQRVSLNFGKDRVQGCDPHTSIAYVTTGTLSELIHASFPGATVDCMVQEFGTSAPFKVLHALREENQRFFASDRQFSGRSDTNLATVFMPSSSSWRNRVLARGLAVYGQALAAE
jgi:hypothetical protein